MVKFTHIELFFRNYKVFYAKLNNFISIDISAFLLK